MCKLKINYGNCESIYEYKTLEERQKKLDNLIWAWNLIKVSNSRYNWKAEGYVEII